MGDHALPGKPPVPLTLRKSARARRISLRISQLDGRVTLTYPKGVAEAEALDFARVKEDWIRQHLQDRPTPAVVAVGRTVPVEGKDRRIVAAEGRRVPAGRHRDCGAERGRGAPVGAFPEGTGAGSFDRGL